jgi:hypothetical protein
MPEQGGLVYPGSGTPGGKPGVLLLCTREIRIQRTARPTPSSDIRPESHLDDGVVRDLEKSGARLAIRLRNEKIAKDAGYIDDPASRRMMVSCAM